MSRATVEWTLECWKREKARAQRDLGELDLKRAELVEDMRRADNGMKACVEALADPDLQ